MKKLLLTLSLVVIGLFTFGQNDSCINVGFESGDCSGWEAIIGKVPDFGTTTDPFGFIPLDTVSCDTSVQHNIMFGGFDSFAGVHIPRVFPDGSASLRLGDSIGTGYGAARIQQTFLVDSIDNAFAYHYAMVLENPAGHTVEEAPYFMSRVVTQSGDTIYENDVLPFDASSGGDPDFVPFTGVSTGGVYLPWKTKYVDLSGYVGEYVTVEFTVGDCGQGGHFGYAYVDAECMEPTSCMFVDFEFKDVLPVQCALPGNIAIDILGGEPPFTYDWSSGDTTSSISPINSGFYDLTLTDSSGCGKTKTVLVNGYEYPLGYDMRVYLNSNSFRAGQQSWVRVNAFNDGCSSVSGQIKLILDDRVTLSSTYPIPDIINGDTLIWNTDSLNYDSTSFSPYIYVTTDVSVNVGEELCFNVELTPVIGDIDTTNNNVTLCKNVVNSYDPNFKAVYPQGECDENYVLIDEELTYTVHFQNTGTASAINIYVMDTLNSNLDINSLRVVSQSHEGLITEVVNGNTLKFIYDNIHLPDSASDEVASHGYVVFKVKPNGSISHDTRVENRVGIYFDYNDPIITNAVFNTFVDSVPHKVTVLNEISVSSYELNGIVYDSTDTYYQELYSAEGCDSTVVLNLTITTTGINLEKTGALVNIFPNPISNKLNVNVSAKIDNYEIEIYSITGELVFKGSNITSINTVLYPQGIYQIKFWSENHVLVRKIVKQ